LLITVSALNQAHHCLNSYGQMIEDIRVCLIPFCVVRHVGRQTNIAAYTLAKYTVFEC
jgi:hypothetical protein